MALTLPAFHVCLLVQAIWRFLLGVGAGGVYPLSAAYASSSSEKVRRGSCQVVHGTQPVLEHELNQPRVTSNRTVGT